MNFVDLSYFHNRTTRFELLLEAHRPNLGYFDHLPTDWKCTLVKFADVKGQVPRPAFDYHYFKGRSAKLWLPLAADRFIARLKPDVVMVHGLIFPQQVLLLKAFLPKKSRIIIQHHAEKPGTVKMQRLQRLANKYVDAYLFATKELAKPWIDARIIEKEKVYEVMEGSSVIPRMDKAVARQYLGLGVSTPLDASPLAPSTPLGTGPIFLWVGRLDNNKNPVKALVAFDDYLKVQPGAKLIMVYRDAEPDMLKLVNHMIGHSPILKDAVILKSNMDRSELAYWYNAADYYLSTSYSEGSGYALIEAMSCGCIPVVSDIPSFRKITGNGAFGFLFPLADIQALVDVLCGLHEYPGDSLVPKILSHFEEELSFEAIARQLVGVCERLR